MAGAALAVRERTPEGDGYPGEGPGLRSEAAADAGPSEAETLEELGDEIARMAAHLDASQRRYLELVAEFDRRRGREPEGYRSYDQ